MRTLAGGILLLLCWALPTAAQDAPRIELSGGYTFVRANAPPGSCGCFSMNGGSVAAAYNVTNSLGLVGDLTVVHNGNIHGSGMGLTLTSYTFGPRYSWRRDSRLTPFGEILLGGVYGSAMQGNSSAFAMNLGGGLDLKVSEQWSVHLLETDYYYTHFNNGVNSNQNNFRIGAGIVFRIGQH